MVSARTMLPRDFDILLCSKSSQPWATIDLRQRQSGGHQKCRPVDAVEAGDLLADEVQVGRPEFLEFGLVCGIIAAVAEGGDVVGQRVEPDVDDVLLVAGNGDAPGEAGAADGEIAAGRCARRR